MMHSLKRGLFAIATILALVSSSVSVVPGTAAAATMDASNIVSDSVFENISSMSAPQIDAFLNSYSSSCISQNNGFSTPDPLGFSSSENKYTFGNNVTAGQAIYDIAQNYHMSPEVVLATMQKEQSIPTGSAGCHSNSPDPASAVNSPCGSAKSPCTSACPYSGGCMNIAMSYACPNYCYAGIEGFGNQLSAGTWILRYAEQRAYGNLTGYKGYDTGDDNFTYSGPMTPGYRQRVTGGASIYYDGSYTTNDGVSVSITNGATASLYYYTPFISGNQSFVNLFEDTFHFGSTIAGGCVGNEPMLPYVQRYYNARTFEHFYSAYGCDQSFLASIGFKLEGAVFNTSPCDATYATPIYRYYNPQTGLHMWDTANLTQAQLDVGKTGYHVEAGKVFCVAKAGMPGVHPIVRFYNPKTYLHMWAADPSPADLRVLNGPAGYTQSDGTVFWTQ